MFSSPQISGRFVQHNPGLSTKRPSSSTRMDYNTLVLLVLRMRQNWWRYSDNPKLNFTPGQLREGWHDYIMDSVVKC